MALLDMFDGMNIFAAKPSEALTGLLEKDPNALEKLKNQSLMSGLLSAGATYLAQPKNQNIGLGAILGKTYLGGMQGAQGSYDTALKGKIDAYNLAKTQKQIEMEGAPDIQKLMMWRDSLKTDSPTYKQDLQSINNEITKVSTHAPPQTNIDLSNFMGRESYKPFVEKTTAVSQAGYNSAKSMPSLNEMESLVKSGVPTGAGAEFAKSVSRVGQIFNPDFNVKNLSAQEAFSALSTQAILPRVKQLGVNPTDTDLRFIVEGSAGLSKSQAGNMLLIKALKLSAQRDQEVAKFSNQWRVKNAALVKKDPYLADAQYDQDMMNYVQTNPLFTDSANQLKAEYNRIVTNQGNPDVNNALQNGGLIKK